GEEVAVDVAAAPADQFEHVGVPLLRHHAAAGGVAVGDPDEAELGGHVDDPLLGPAEKPLCRHCTGIEEVASLITIRRCEDAVWARPPETCAPSIGVSKLEDNLLVHFPTQRQ